MQRNPENDFLDYLNSKANSLTNDLSKLAAGASKFINNTSLSVPSSSNHALSNGSDSTGILVFGGICITALVVIGGLIIYSMGRKC